MPARRRTAPLKDNEVQIDQFWYKSIRMIAVARAKAFCVGCTTTYAGEFRPTTVAGLVKFLRSFGAPRKRAQLKGKEGSLLSRAEEAVVFCEHFKKKFTSVDAWCFDYTSYEACDQSKFQLVDGAQLQQDLFKAPLRLCADLVATTIATILNPFSKISTIWWSSSPNMLTCLEEAPRMRSAECTPTATRSENLAMDRVIPSCGGSTGRHLFPWLGVFRLLLI